jgi:hypothetical protein
MTPIAEERERVALATLQTAADWRRKHNDRMELSCLSSGVKSLLGVSVTQASMSHDGIAYLRSRDLGVIIQRIAQLNGNLYQALLAASSAPAAAVSNDIAPVHIGWLLGEWEAANTLLEICVDSRVSKHFPLTKFWSEYYRGLLCLANQSTYDPLLPKLRGYEKCWAPYLFLISDLTHGRDSSSSRDEIAKMFAQRNRDKRLTDWRMIDGDGKHPVQWDFRETSIMHFNEHLERRSAS